MDLGCDSKCQNNRINSHHKSHQTSTIYAMDWVPMKCYDDGACSVPQLADPLLALGGNGFPPNTYASFEIYSHETKKLLWSGNSPVGNLGYIYVETPLRDCSGEDYAVKNNAYAQALDARSSKWGKPLDLTVGCKRTTY
jgi:hypothetical protein